MITGNAGTTLLDAVRGWTPSSPLWPTPDATVSNDGEELGTFLVRKEVHATKENATRATRVARRGGVLNPVFVEALMGWPLGWTDPLRPSGPSVPFPPPPKGDWATYLMACPGTEPALPKSETLEHRTDRLRACGNGVVPQQAAAAIGELLGALGVLWHPPPMPMPRKP